MNATQLIEALNRLAREYDPTGEYRLPVHDAKWMEHAAAIVRGHAEVKS